ncbi:protein kinase and PP2C-like domain-containing protein isoform X2 [Hevea brasiliensis]|uniref:protein kinase and PP2C-like domain-containing protein isoform X2 n=1 Tax=Hevea brasiliensis TaxID=3981 RepID=UPI0025D3227A|nr:protein kinase and PP2C-like domain-containing protein isoform X2 [Hevea brasiliensis]
MGLEIVEPNTCIRGCCSSNSIPLHLPPSSYALLSPIARGAESVVYEGILDGRKVAVKKPILSTSDDIDKFHKELQLLCTLDHPGIAKLVAAHAKPPNYLFFFEFYESGNLAGKLHVEEWSPRIDQVLMITVQLAKALQYLHDHGIVHRDVKPANVLLDKNLCPHLADFGLAEYRRNLTRVSVESWRSSGKPTGGFHKKNMVGTLIYMAPEILRKEVHTEKSDVYSFGISINELLTGVVPYTDLRAEAQAYTVLEMNYTEQQLTAAVVSCKLRPVLAGPESGASTSMLTLIQRCWDENPQNRPSFSDIILEICPILEHRKKSMEENFAPGASSILEVEQFIDGANNLQTFLESVNWSTQGKQLSKKASLAVNSHMNNWLDSLNEPLAYHPVLSLGSFATCGRRETMEDAHFLMPHMCNEKDIHAFGIFDGHRGAAAAEFSVQALPGFLQSLASIRSPIDALFEAFVSTDAAFRNELDSHRKSKGVVQKDWHPGCAAVAALIVRNKLFVANAGDCRTILCRAGDAFPLSKDHVASCLEERERVISAGGQVKWQVDTWRVGPAALQVMASDGLWDVVSNAEVISIIRDTVKEPGMCSKRLATEAVERGSKDNITVVVVFLRPVSTAERIY